MKGYQAGISEFDSSDAVVFGISTDPIERNKEFAEALELQFSLLSDTDGAVAAAYGVHLAGPNMASRTTFVIDKSGSIANVFTGADAMDPNAAAGACGNLK